MMETLERARQERSYVDAMREYEGQDVIRDYYAPHDVYGGQSYAQAQNFGQSAYAYGAQPAMSGVNVREPMSRGEYVGPSPFVGRNGGEYGMATQDTREDRDRDYDTRDYDVRDRSFMGYNARGQESRADEYDSMLSRGYTSEPRQATEPMVARTFETEQEQKAGKIRGKLNGKGWAILLSYLTVVVAVVVLIAVNAGKINSGKAVTPASNPQNSAAVQTLK